MLKFLYSNSIGQVGLLWDIPLILHFVRKNFPESSSKKNCNEYDVIWKYIIRGGGAITYGYTLFEPFKADSVVDEKKCFNECSTDVRLFWYFVLVLDQIPNTIMENKAGSKKILAKMPLIAHSRPKSAPE